VRGELLGVFILSTVLFLLSNQQGQTFEGNFQFGVLFIVND